MIFENKSREQFVVVEQGKGYIRLKRVNEIGDDTYWFSRSEFQRYFHVNNVQERATKPKRINMRVKQAH